MSILEFKASLLSGGARANQFRVTLNFPSFVSGGTSAAQKAQFLCEAASLPGQTVNITPVMYRGREVKLAGERRFDNWQITVINDNDFAIHNAFESWMNIINNRKENTGLTNPLAYTIDLQVEQLDRNGVSLKSYTFADSWPTAVSPIQLNFGDNDNVERFQVDIAYSWFDVTGNVTGISANVGISSPFGGAAVGI